MWRRNAVYLARHGVDVLAIDQSEAAIRQAKGYADNLENVKFIAGDCLELDYGCRQYDVAIDSGLFHHLSPHRRLQYRDILKSVVKEKGYLVLLYFSAGAGGADEVDDLEF